MTGEPSRMYKSTSVLFNSLTDWVVLERGWVGGEHEVEFCADGGRPSEALYAWPGTLTL